MELLVTVLALRRNLLPANAGIGEAGVDAASGLEHVLLQNEAAVPGAGPGLALSNSFAFGGLNAVLAVRRHES